MNDIEKTYLKISSPALFGKYILNLDIQPFHEEWLDFIQRYPYTLLLSCRGSGKSTISTVLYSVWLALVNRKARILVVSNTAYQAKEFGRQIRAYLESNEVRDIFGDIMDQPWTTEELRLKGHGNQKESNITVLGMGGAVLGRHFDCILMDDVVDQENSATSDQRRKVLSWYQAVMLPCLEPGGEVHVVGTRFHASDLYSMLETDPTYKTKIYSAIKPDGTSIWPERLSLDILNDRKSQMGSVNFAMQFENKIVSDETSVFKELWLQYYTELPKNVELEYYQGVDLAISKEGDYFVDTTVAYNRDSGSIYVVDIVRKHLTFAQQVEVIKDKAEEYQPIRIAIESNAYQKTMASELKRTTMLPIKEVSTLKNKMFRARKLSALFENGKIFIRPIGNNFSILKDELLYFPRSQNDDCLDSLELAVLAIETRKSVDWEDFKKFIYVGNYVQKV